MNIKNIRNIQKAILPEIVSEKERVTMGFKYLGKKAVDTNKLERFPDVDIMEFGREFLQNSARKNIQQQNIYSTKKIMLGMQDAINNLF